MKNIFIFIGIIAGITMCFFEAIISYSDTAPLDDEIGIEIVSWKFFLLKILIYSIIGGVVGFIIKKLLHYYKNGR